MDAEGVCWVFLYMNRVLMRRMSRCFPQVCKPKLYPRLARTFIEREFNFE